MAEIIDRQTRSRRNRIDCISDHCERCEVGGQLDLRNDKRRWWPRRERGGHGDGSHDGKGPTREHLPVRFRFASTLRATEPPGQEVMAACAGAEPQGGPTPAISDLGDIRYLGHHSDISELISFAIAVFEILAADTTTSFLDVS